MKDKQPNIVLITIDCARQDMIYGGEVETPHIDKLREEGITFTNAFSQSSTTIPSLYSLFTSKYLSSHGVITQNPLKYKSLGNESLPAILANCGWNIATFSGYKVLEDIMIADIKNIIKENKKNIVPHKEIIRFRQKIKRKIIRKFHMLIPGVAKARVSYYLNMKSKIRAEDLTDKAIHGLQSGGRLPFFVWIHYFDAHMYYWAPAKWVRRYYKKPASLPRKTAYEQTKENGLWFPEISFGSVLKRTKDINIFPSMYKAALSYIDEQIGRLMVFLKNTNKYENTLIIATADHGENLGENGIFGFHNKLFEHTTKIPLIFRDPEMSNFKGVDSLIQHVDLMPTLLERIQINTPASINGKSLWPCINGGEEVNEYVFAEHAHMYQKTVISKEWQYLWADPHKRHPLGLEFESGVLLDRRKGDNKNYASRYPEICKAMEGIIHKLSEGCKPDEEKEEEVPQELAEKLTALGYFDM